MTSYGNSDDMLILLFSKNMLPNIERFSDSDLKRVLLLAATGKMFLSQTMGEDIDKLIRRRVVESKRNLDHWMDELEDEVGII
jgi:hypothetical protein